MPPFIKKPAGFGLVEVLITSIILAIGLIGIASLQVRSIRTIQEGDNLVMASMIAKEMAARMLANPYQTSLGRTSQYMSYDLSGGEVANFANSYAWAEDKLSETTNILQCYPEVNSESCFAGTSTTSGTNQTNALIRLALMDLIEMRYWAWNSLPNGEVKVCFDSTTPATSWDCDNVATRITARSEDIFTIKVRWNNIFDNEEQIYVTQFTAVCSNSAATHCGN